MITNKEQFILTAVRGDSGRRVWLCQKRHQPRVTGAGSNPDRAFRDWQRQSRIVELHDARQMTLSALGSAGD